MMTGWNLGFSWQPWSHFSRCGWGKKDATDSVGIFTGGAMENRA